MTEFNSNSQHSDSLQELEQVFRKLFRKKMSEWSKKVERDTSDSQAIILESLQKAGMQRVTELADTLDITAGAITALCDKMVTSGLVQRNRVADDRRLVMVEITPKGREVLKEICQLRKEMVNIMYGSLSEEDILHLLRIYTMVLANLEKGRNS